MQQVSALLPAWVRLAPRREGGGGGVFHISLLFCNDDFIFFAIFNFLFFFAISFGEILFVYLFFCNAFF